MGREPLSPITREQVEEALLRLIEACLPAYSSTELDAIWDAALKVAKSRLARDLLDAWKWECAHLEQED